MAHLLQPMGGRSPGSTPCATTAWPSATPSQRPCSSPSTCPPCPPVATRAARPPASRPRSRCSTSTCGCTHQVQPTHSRIRLTHHRSVRRRRAGCHLPCPWLHPFFARCTMPQPVAAAPPGGSRGSYPPAAGKTHLHGAMNQSGLNRIHDDLDRPFQRTLSELRCLQNRARNRTTLTVASSPHHSPQARDAPLHKSDRFSLTGAGSRKSGIRFLRNTQWPEGVHGAASALASVRHRAAGWRYNGWHGALH